MANKSVIDIIKNYLNILIANGIPAQRAVLYGSHARGTAGAESDIDILVISPLFDKDRWSCEAQLWRLTLKADPCIEPIPVGEQQFEEDNVSPLIEMARREGIVVEV